MSPGSASPIPSRHLRRAALGLSVVTLVGSLFAGTPREAPAAAPPAVPLVARRDVVVDSAFGIRLEDPYQWMERRDSEFLAWLRSQGDFTRRRLDAIPERRRLIPRLRELSLETSGVHSVDRHGSTLFYLRDDAGNSLAKLVARSPDGKERVLVDPNRATPEGGHVSIDNYSVSWDGKLVAVNLAPGGSEVSRVVVFDTETGRQKPDTIEHIWGQFPVNWLPDGSGFFYTQMADAAFRDPKVDRVQGMRARRHLLGTPVADDPVLLGPDSTASLRVEPREFPVIDVPRGSQVAIAYCVGLHPEVRMWMAPIGEVRRAGTPWRRIAEYEDRVGTFAIDSSSLYVMSHQGAPNGKVLRLSSSDPNLATAEELVPQSERVLLDFALAKDGLYSVETDAGVDRLFRRRPGSPPEEIPLPIAGAIKGLDADPAEPGVFFWLAQWMRPETYYHYDPAGRTLRDFGLGTRSRADFSKFTAERVEVKSFDGTMVPLTILHAQGIRRNGAHRTILSGYGALGSSIRPAFNASRLAWLERGGVLAYAHVRGGGEKGQAWHQAGKGPKKETGIGDFIACAEYLVARGYTTPSRLAAMGSSGGGPLVGGALMRRPDLFGAAVLLNAVLNSTRILEGTNGANQVAEMGSPETEAGLRGLIAQDPTLAIRDGMKYPPVMVTVGLNDNRVPLWHSGKFAARLMTASPSTPVFVRVESEMGHGVGSTRDQAVQLNADIYSFLLRYLAAPQPKSHFSGTPVMP